MRSSAAGVLWHRHLLTTAPGRPSITNIGTVAAAAFLYVDVAPPTSNGGARITAYEVTGTPVGGPAPGRPTLTTTGAGTPTIGVNNRRFTFADYPRGVAYRFTVRARNQAGLSPASTPATAFTTSKLGVPGPPVVTLTRLPDGFYLDITPPAQVLARPLTYTLVGHPDGGATAQRPRIVITGTGSLVPTGQAGAGSSNLGQQPGRRGGTAPTQTTRRFRITGLLPNTVYRFAVSAANSAGAGPENVPRIVLYECRNGFKDTGAGCQCAPLANCKTYSQVDCKCTQCNPGWGDCDARPANGCERALNTTTNCGRCNAKCVLANATPRCDRGTCKIASCARGWGDCDNNPANGCETRLNTTSNCGRCNNTCALPQATATCATGTCQVASCAQGWGDCDNNPANGCETRLNTTSNCGRCNNTCALSQATGTCTTGTCQVASCAQGWGDCDNNPANGCETRLNTTSNCGRCNNTCALSQATGTCATGTCEVASCAAGWGDCDGISDTGCETRLNTTTNCGRCNNTCALSQATATCATGTCEVASCAQGWDNCDDDPSNGCEADLAAPQTCGSCSTACTPDQLCLDGACVINALAMAWGWNFAGQLGDGTDNNPTGIPTPVIGDPRFQQITAGYEHTCAIDTMNQAWCWGQNREGQLGIGADRFSLVPASVSGDRRFKQITAGEEHTCAIDTTNQAWCWGGKRAEDDAVAVVYVGQLGASTGEGSRSPVAVSGNIQFQQISAGSYHTCGIDTENQAWCWGVNGDGQLGDGTEEFEDRDAPTLVSGNLQFKDISAGEYHSCAIDTSNQAWCWGDNFFDQLGNNTVGSSDVPIQVGGNLRFQQISASEGHTCAIDTMNQAAWCWGSNFNGELGDGTYADRDAPTLVSGDLRFKQISTGEGHTCALTTDGQAWCWGLNLDGQLGIGTVDTFVADEIDAYTYTKPVGVIGNTRFLQISVGDYHAAALVASAN